ncbi:glycosyltransferase [Aureivirga sp. CE67]|uniref:glycosyltransferase n=1 Tax=Aureivirga sp. CE67 TaxID=1788983 RepID=UPI0018CAC077|nr:glycosyltransferase [Aureivirga sp. CE67]
MRNVVIVNDTWTLVNGISTIYLNLLEEFKKQKDINFIFVYPSKEYEINYLEQNIIECGLALKFKLKIPFYKDITQGVPRFKWYSFLKNKFGDIDIIHLATPGMMGVYFANVAKKRGIHTTGFYHTFMPLFARKYMPNSFPFLKNMAYNIFKKIDQKVYGNCKEIFYHTEESKEYLSTFLKDKKYIPVTEFIPTQKFLAYNQNNTKDINQEKTITFGYIGRLAKEKNIEQIVKLESSFKKNNIRFVFIGDGPMTTYINENSELEVTGFLKGKALFKQIQELDFNVIPSATDTLNMTLLEAATQNVPSIGFNNSVPSKLIEKYNSGYTYDCFKNPTWLKDFREEVSQESYTKLQQNCSNLVQDVDISKGSEKLLQVWRKPKPKIVKLA